MTTALLYPHIEKPQCQPARLQRVSRVRVAQIVMDYLAQADEMCRQHAYLRPAEVHAAMSYYFDHQEEIDDEIRQEWEQARRERTDVGHSPILCAHARQGTAVVRLIA